MPRTIQIPDALYARLERAARPFVDREPADLITWLLDQHEQRGGQGDNGSSGLPLSPASSTPFDSRMPRQRGARVEIDGVEVNAHSVGDLYEQTLGVLVKNGLMQRLSPFLPYKTSAKRYLIAQQPVHPNGNRFVVPISHGQLHMEAHKSYYTALKQLEHLLSRCGIPFQYLG